MTDFSDTRVFWKGIAVFTIFFNQFGTTHFSEGFFGRHARVGGFHGAEFIDFELAVVLREAIFGVDGRVFDVGKLDGKPNKKHRNEGDDKKNHAKENVEETFEVSEITVERSNVDAESWSVPYQFKVAELRRKSGFTRDEIVEDVAIDRLLIDVFGLTFVGLEDDVGLSIAKSIFK